MKVIRLLFVFYVLVSLISCPNPSGGGEDEKNNVSLETPGADESAKTYIVFKNTSSFPVCVYYGENPYRNATVYADVIAGGESAVEFTGNTDITATFFFVYQFDFGADGVSFPYFPEDPGANHKSLRVTAHTETPVIIDEITQCKTKSAFLLLDNQTTSDIYIVLADAAVVPYGAIDKFVSAGSKAVYEIGDDGSFLLESAYRAQVSINAELMDLPGIAYEAGKIYAVEVSNSGASLKSISPFNVDTRDQIWYRTAFSDGAPFLVDVASNVVPRLRPSRNGGTLVMGTMNADATQVGIKRLDVYGRQAHKGGCVSIGGNYDGFTLQQSRVIDFYEESDGSIVMLLQNIYARGGSYFIETRVEGYAFESRTPKWHYVFPDVGEDGVVASYMTFRADSRNILVPAGAGRVAVAGARVYVDGGSMHQYVGLLSIPAETGGNAELVAEWENADGTSGGVEQMFTSAYYDGASLYAVGYAGFDGTYSVPHTGVVYSFGSSLEGAAKIYGQSGCLFFGIEGTDAGYAVCGEAYQSGVLKGCYLSSAMIAKNAPCMTYTAPERRYCWFTQLCRYADGLTVMLGEAANDQSGATNPMPFVVAYGGDGACLWENAYLAYSSAYSCVANQIGTYVVQLADSGGGFRLVSADLLGNDTGEERK